MRKNEYVLAIDCGTQSLRTMIFDTKGSLAAMEKIPYEPYSEIEPGRAEQDPEIYWQSLCTALTRLKEHAGSSYAKIEGIGVTSQRDSMICLDEKGDPLRPAILWLDQRKADICYKPGFPMKQIFFLIGMGNTIRKMQRDGKCNWIRQHEPHVWERTYKYVQLSGFLHQRITGEWKDSIASQIGHIPFDYKKQRWASENALTAKLYPVEQEKLVELVPPGSEIGKITDEFAHISGLRRGIPVIACGSDKGCETLGMGVVDEEAGSLSFGTTATIQTTVSTYMEPLKFLPSYPAPIPGRYNPEVEIFRGFWMIKWFKEQFGYKEIQEAKGTDKSPEELLDTMLGQTSPGASGLLVQPYWSPGLKNPYAKGAMIGFGSAHTRAHIYRSMIEGLCYALLDGRQRIEHVTGKKMRRIAVSGGASSSDSICRIAADIFGLPILRGKTIETSGLGAACIIQYGIGSFESIQSAVQSMVSYHDTFKPTAEHHEMYMKLFGVYQKIYPSLQRLYREIGTITQYPELY